VTRTLRTLLIVPLLGAAVVGAGAAAAAPAPTPTATAADDVPIPPASITILVDESGSLDDADVRAEQEAAGIPREARDRSYPDPSHKPELLFALTRLEGMAGFRDVESSAAILCGLQLCWLDDVARDLEGDPPSALRSVVTRWLALPPAATRVRLKELREAAIGAEARAHRAARLHRPEPVDAAHVSRESVRVYAATVPLIDRYPDDPGVLVTLLLNHLVLAPGEAMFVDAGIVHAYTSGFGVEIMATSDNVLRAGLTPKHVDIPELLEVADFRPIPPPRQRPVRTGGVLRLTPPALLDEHDLLWLDGALHAAARHVAGVVPLSA